LIFTPDCGTGYIKRVEHLAVTWLGFGFQANCIYRNKLTMNEPREDNSWVENSWIDNYSLERVVLVAKPT
jgi:hypothetical protein